MFAAQYHEHPLTIDGVSQVDERSWVPEGVEVGGCLRALPEPMVLLLER